MWGHFHTELLTWTAKEGHLKKVLVFKRNKIQQNILTYTRPTFFYTMNMCLLLMLKWQLWRFGLVTILCLRQNLLCCSSPHWLRNVRTLLEAWREIWPLPVLTFKLINALCGNDCTSVVLLFDNWEPLCSKEGRILWSISPKFGNSH